MFAITLGESTAISKLLSLSLPEAGIAGAEGQGGVFSLLTSATPAKGAYLTPVLQSAHADEFLDLVSEINAAENTAALTGQIEYGSSDLSQAAQAYRQSAGITGGRNVAVFEYQAADGSLQTIAGASARGVGHAERIIGGQLSDMGIAPSQVTRIYSELQPCNMPGGYCAPYIARTFPQAPVTWSFEYGATAESRAAGVAALKNAQGQ